MPPVWTSQALLGGSTTVSVSVTRNTGGNKYMRYLNGTYMLSALG
jgi:hypothetical protein